MTSRFGAGMAGPNPAGAVPGSLFEATATLEGVIAAASAIDPWCVRLQAALQECTAAVQYHLDTLDGDDGMKEHVTREEPRLISRLESLDHALRDLLGELGEARQSPAASTSALLEPLARLVGELRDAAIGEVEILHESIISTGSGD